MKIKFLSVALLLGLSSSLVGCGEGEEKKEEPKADTTSVVEEPEEPAYEYTYKVEEVSVEPHWAVTIGDSVSLADMQSFFGKNFPALGKFVSQKKMEAQAPLAFYTNFSMDKKFYTVAAMYVNDSTLKVKSPMKLEKLYSGKAIKVVYTGDYKNMMKAYEDMEAYMKEKNLMPVGPNWEHYITDPMLEKDTTKWETDIYFPVASKTEK